MTLAVDADKEVDEVLKDTELVVLFPSLCIRVRVRVRVVVLSPCHARVRVRD